MKEHYSRIAKSSPIDVTARSVVQRGTRYEPSGGDGWFTECPPIVEITPQQISSGFRDLTGRTLGRLRVIGYIGKSRWACMCWCGRYTRQKGSAIAHPRESDDPVMCSVCNNTLRVKKGKPSYLKAAQ